MKRRTEARIAGSKMNISIEHGFEKVLAGASARHVAERSYGEELVALLNEVWPRLRAKDVKSNGINVVVYDPDGTLFAGVELPEAEALRCGLASRRVALRRYGYFKHVGPYTRIHQTCVQMAEELRRLGHRPVQPVVEIYGHWTEDESRLETEILHAIAD
jgi:hypothetical protein